eukprot:1157934-Pelagomonas_calceolata.AAC.3
MAHNGANGLLMAHSGLQVDARVYGAHNIRKVCSHCTLQMPLHSDALKSIAHAALTICVPKKKHLLTRS